MSFFIRSLGTRYPHCGWLFSLLDHRQHHFTPSLTTTSLLKKTAFSPQKIVKPDKYVNLNRKKLTYL
jgi:hypothetical protein